MCNIAGYIGTREAAPVLLEMMEKQEGFAGGFYTGIATLHEGKLHHAKVVGDVATLRKHTHAEHLPGTIGILHSRSKSGGDREWAHPFLDCRDRLAYIANGHDGFYESMRDKDKVAAQLLTEGHILRSRTDGTIGSYPRLPGDTCVHTSEVMCHLIESLACAYGCPAKAMRAAFMDFPAEIVGLVLTVDLPDAIIASRINQPLMIGGDAENTYLATTAMAFPEPLQWLTPMPCNTTAVVRQSRLELLPFDTPPALVSDSPPWHAGTEAILRALADGNAHPFGELTKITQPHWPEKVPSQRDMMTYEILRRLQQQNTIRFEVALVPGVNEETHAPQFRARLTQAPKEQQS